MAYAVLTITRNLKASTAVSSVILHSGEKTKGRTTAEPTRFTSSRQVRRHVFLSSTLMVRIVNRMRLSMCWQYWGPGWGKSPRITQLPRPWLGHARLHLSFLHPIAVLLGSVQPGVQPHMSFAIIRDNWVICGLWAGLHQPDSEVTSPAVPVFLLFRPIQ